MFGLSQKEKNQAFREACAEGDVEGALRALDRGVNIREAVAPAGHYPLIWAAGHWDQDVALEFTEKFIERGADPDMRIGGGETPLAAALERSNIPVMRYLIEEGVDPIEPATNGQSLMQLALGHKNWSVAKFLIDEGYGPGLNAHGNGLIIEMLEAGAPSDLIKLAVKTVGNINAQYHNRRLSPLGVAVQKQRSDIVEYLLEQPGIEIDIVNNAERTPLHIAINNGFSDMATLLIGKGADLFKKESRDLDALALAASKNMMPVIRAVLGALKERKEPVNLDRAMQIAAYNGNAHVVSLIVEAGADVNSADERGRTAAIKAAGEGHVGTLKMLAKLKADMLKPDNNGMPPLDHAVQAGKTEAVEYLKTLQPGYVAPPPPPPPIDTSRFVRVSDTTIDVKERNGLTMTFNFWTQQLIYRETERGSALSVQNFADVPRREAVLEAFEKLKQLGGRPPEPFAEDTVKKAVLPKP